MIPRILAAAAVAVAAARTPTRAQFRLPAKLLRWGPDAREEFLIRNDRTIRIASEQFPKLRELLGPPK